tara:strand:+ start:2704 stop:3252 length:549 start_codon:yes stop_codon:yes gene_type:complete
MKNIALIFTFLFCSAINGQNKTIEFPTEKNGGKTFAYEYFKKIINDIPLERLEISENEYHFRYITPKHIAEIWKDENGKIAGKIFSFVEKQPDSTNLEYLNNETKRIYFLREESMKKENAVNIYKKLNKLKLENIKSTKKQLPNNKNMKGVMLEFSNKESYKFKEFWYSEKIENTTNKKLRL